MTRRFRFLLIGPAVVIGATASLGVTLLYHPAGLEFAVTEIRKRMPEPVRLGAAEGRLAGPIRLAHIEYDDGATAARFRDIEIDWQPTALLGGRVAIDRIAVGRIDYREAASDDDGAEPPAAWPAVPAAPIPLSVERISLGPVTVRDAENAPVVELRQLTASGRWTAGNLAVSFDLAGGSFAADGGFRADTGEKGAVESRISWRIHPEDMATVAGRLHVSGRPGDLALRQTFTDPGRATLEAQVTGPPAAPVLTGNLRIDSINARAIDPTWPDATLGGHLNLTGEWPAWRARGALQLKTPDRMPVNLALDLAGTPEQLVVHSLAARPEGTETEVTLTGAADFSVPAPRLSADLRWRHLRWPLAGEPFAASAAGHARLSGTPEAADWHVDAAVETPGWPGGRLAGRGRLNADAVTADALDIRWLDGRIRGNARYGFEHARLDTTIRAEGVNPGRLVPDWPGKITLAAESRLTFADGPRGRLTIHRADGTLRERTVGAGGTVAWNGTTFSAEALRLSVGDNRLSVGGRFPGEGIDWTLDAPALDQIMPSLGGSLTAEGRIAGDRAEPDIRARADAEMLATPWFRMKHGELSLDTVALGRGPSHLSLDFAELSLPDGEPIGGEIGFEGNRAEHRLRVEARAGESVGRLELTGGLAESGWQGRVLALELRHPKTGPWTLHEPAAMAFRHDPAMFRMAPFCLERGDGRICGRGDWHSEEAWSLRTDIEQLPAALVLDPLMPGMDIEGTLAGHLAASGRGATWRGEARLRSGRISIEQRLEGDTAPVAVVETLSLSANADARPDAWSVDTRIEMPGIGSLRGRLGERSGALDGRFNATLRELELAAALVPEIGHMDGRLDAELTVRGTPEAPELGGSARLTGGRLELPQLGIDIDPLTLQAEGGNNRFRLTADAQSGPGTLRLDADLAYRQSRWEGTVNLGGERFRAVDLPRASLLVTPDLALSVTGRQLDLTGSVTVPTARLEPRDLSGTVGSSPDAVLVGSGAARQPVAPGWQLNAEVRTRLGEDVRFDGLGLKARFTGELTVCEAPGELTTAVGELQVMEGSYKAWGQELTIDSGRLIFDGGPLAQPGLDIRAVRRPRNVLVGVHVRGTLDRPRISLFSEPPMQQSEQLSWLLFGVPFTETNASQQNQVGSATATLTMAGGEFLGRRLGKPLGVDEVAVERGGEDDQTSLVFGKYLSPRLYVGYGVGLFESVNSWRMRYQLSEHWSLEGISGKESSADLLFTIEVGSEAEDESR